MLLGEDYPKISLEYFGLELLEPNAFIGDVIILFISLYFAKKIKSFGLRTPFFLNWYRFFIVFGVGFILGGFGHLLFHYFGYIGKIPSWISGLFASFFIETAMVSIYPKTKNRSIFQNWIKWKLILAILAETAVFVFTDAPSIEGIGLVIPALSSTIGLVLCLGILGNYYRRTIHYSFRYLCLSLIVLVPSALFQGLKINFSPYFDRNDASHLFLIFSLFFYFACLKRFAKVTS